MPTTRWALAALLLLGGAAVGATRSETDGVAKMAEEHSWTSVKFAVARNSVASHIQFYRSMRLWAHPHHSDEAAGQDEFVDFDSDVAQEVALPGKRAVHIRGSLAAPLHVGDHSEVVIGGSVVRGGRIEADGIVAVHVQGDIEGVVVCNGMAEVWVGGDLRGEVFAGAPVMHLHVAGDLSGSVRPVAKPALLYVDVRGHATSKVLASIDRHRFTMLQIAVASGDLGQGLHPLWTGTNGFVAITGDEPLQARVKLVQDSGRR